MGTYQIALVAKALQKPFYVAVESYKFARLYPLTQRDLALTDSVNRAHQIFTASAVPVDDGCSTGCDNTNSTQAISNPTTEVTDSDNDSERKKRLHQHFPGMSWPLSANVTVDIPTTDFTPASLIALLFTDLGVLTPAAVSDELIRLYQ